jgi:hypothetical protein
MIPCKGYNRKAYAERFPFAERLTSQEWCDRQQVFIIDADGWRDDPMSWGRRITEAEFNSRLLHSTIMHRVPDKAAIAQ